MHHLHLRRLLLPLFAVPAALAQSGGPLLGAGQGFSVDVGTVLGAFTPASVITTRTELSDATPPPLPPPPGMPDFAAVPIPAALDVDALAVGYDWIPTDGTGVAVVTPGNWAAVTWSVNRLTAGLVGSRIAAEVAAVDGAAGDVFGYVFPGSALPAELVDVPFRGLDSTEINISTPAAAGDIDAHDLYIGLLWVENPQLAAMLPPPTLWFSVTNATAAAIPPAWAAPGLRTGSTVFSTTWSPTTSSWSPPAVAITAAMLGITPGEDVDGLAVDLLHSCIVFSTDLTVSGPFPLRNPLLYSNYGSGSHTTYRLPGGTPVATALGVGGSPDDIDGICFVDPGGIGGSPQLRFDRIVGRPGFPVVPTAPTTLSSSLLRRFDQPGNSERVVALMTGWPAPGTPATGFVVQAWTIGPPAVGPWVTDGFFLRPDPNSPYFVFQGHPHRHELVVPPGFGGSGVPLSSVWAAFSASTFALSPPATLVL